MAGRCLVGTCGFSYDHWRPVFYPAGLPAGERLSYYARRFDTVEINSTFYRLPPPEVFARWRNETPPGFRFSVKGSRYITHYKRLADCVDAVAAFFNSAGALEGKFEAVLWQTPPTASLSAAAVDGFLTLTDQAAPAGVRQAFEFRAGEMTDPVMAAVLETHGCGCVIADGDRHHDDWRVHAGFAYVRLHGRSDFGYDYPDHVLVRWAKRLSEWRVRGIDSYVYFNNDTSGFAVRNAKRLEEELTRDLEGERP